MRRFLTSPDASFIYNVDFSTEKFANISFFDASRKDILFHLSLRQAKSIAVTNAKQRGKWANEKPFKTQFSEGMNKVEITFTPPKITIRVNDAEIEGLTPEIPGIERIRHVNWTGALVEDSIAVSGKANSKRKGDGVVDLIPPLHVWAWGYDPALPSQSLELQVDGLSDPLRGVETSAPSVARRLKIDESSQIALHANLPGRVWETGKKSVVLRVFSNGVPCGKAQTITKEQVVARIEDIAKSISMEKNCVPALLAIEHVRFGKMFDMLSDGAQEYITKAAKLYGCLPFLFSENPEQMASSAPEAAAVDLNEVLVTRVQSAVSEALQNAADPNAALPQVLREQFDIYPMPRAAQQKLLMAQIESACQNDAFDGLYTLMVSMGLQDIPVARDGWSLSNMLPLILRRDGLQAAAEAIDDIANKFKGWANSAPLAWTITQIVRMECNPWEDRFVDQALRGTTVLVERMANAYWTLPCTRMIGATVEMLTQSQRLPGVLAEHLQAFATRCYAMSPLFWELLSDAAAEDQVILGSGLQTAAGAFSEIAAHIDGTEDVDLPAALRVLHGLGCIEAPRVSMELLGGGAYADFQNICANSMDTREVSLRQLAFPGDVPRDADMAETARAVLRRRWNNVDKSAYYEAQLGISRDVVALLAGLSAPQNAGKSEALLTSLLPRIRKLSGQHSNYLGLALLLQLIEATVRHKQPAMADRILAQLNQILDTMPSQMREQAPLAASVTIALIRLDRMAQTTSNRALQTALSFFPNRPKAAEFYPETPVQGPGWNTHSPFFSTLVTVFSCKPYLDSRVKAMREGWLKELQAFGIPYVIIVGDGDGQLDGDVVRLNAPDDYEGLPQKTLATVDWVFNNTDFDHMLKIDDDCFLNVEEYFHSLSYRKFPYYGRGLTRSLGAMNRAWHHEKSQSQRARTELDKSPEPSSYADGGGGYSLNRAAMRALLTARDSDKGAQIVINSFMEDKVVGDLLGTQGVSVSSEDYYTTIWRRTHGPARQVMMWDNYFLPSAASPCKMAHLDTADEQLPTAARRDDNGLWPRKLWPSFQRAGLGFNSNQLELVSGEKTLEKLNAADVAVICVCRNEMARLPAFLAHYRKLGVKCFHFIDNMSDDGTREFLLEQPDTVVFSADTAYKAGRFGVTWQVTAMSMLRMNRWSLVADIDEFLVFPNWESRKLSTYLKSAAVGEADAIRIEMLDMYPSGALSEADLGKGSPFDVAGYTDRAPLRQVPLYRGIYSNDSTTVSAVRHRLMPESRDLLYLAQKYALVRYRPWMRFAAGLHFGAEMNVASKSLIFAHFKYDKTFRDRAAAEVEREAHFNNAEEYRHYLDLFGEEEPQLYDPAISVPWMESAPAKALLEPKSRKSARKAKKSSARSVVKSDG